MTYSNATNITGLRDLLDYGNAVTSYWFGISILVMVFVVLFFSMKQTFSNSRAFVSSIFVTFIIAAFLRMFTIIANLPLLVVIMLLFLGVIWVRLDQ